MATKERELKRLRREVEVLKKKVARLERTRVRKRRVSARANHANWMEQRRRAIAVVGKFHSGHSDIARNHDAYLVEAQELHANHYESVKR